MTLFPKRFGQAVLALAMAVCSVAQAQDALDPAALRAAVAAESTRPRAPQLPRIAFLATSSLRGAWL